MEESLKKIIQKIILDNYDLDLNLDLIKLELPPKKQLGDFAFGCFVLSRDLKKNPAQIAWELKDLLDSNDSIESTNAAGPYLNIKVNKDIYVWQFNELYSKKDNLVENIWSEKTIFIDYIWANVWKPMHIGHMCTPNQGQVLVNLYKKQWYNVVSDSHIWDWGIIFGKLISAYKNWGNEEKLKENAINHLLELYIKATTEAEKHSHLDEEYRKEFKLLSEWNKDSMKFWKEFTRYSIDSMQVQLDRLNIKPDYNIGESFYEWLWLEKMEDYPDLKWDMEYIVNELIEKSIATKNEDNSVWVVFDEELKIPSCILQKRDWTHWYLASDLAAIKYRIDNWNPSKIVYFVDVRQQLHLKQAFLIAKQAKWAQNTELFHAHNWFISLKDGAMSTRKWRIIKLDDLLDDAEARAAKIILEKRDDIVWEELKDLSKIIWIWAIKYGYLKKSRDTDVVFDWDDFMSFEGNSWPYIQYAYVRSRRILENYGASIEIDTKGSFETDEETFLVQKLNEYNDVLKETAEKNMPHILCKYAYELTKAFNSLYNNVWILNEVDEDKKIIRLKLVNLFSLVLKESFEILWIQMPEKM